jgi:hypothetical protein
MVFKAEKRVPPTFIFSGTFIFQSAGNFDSSAMEAVFITTNTALINLTTSGLTLGRGGSLLGRSSTSRILVSAEL